MHRWCANYHEFRYRIEPQDCVGETKWVDAFQQTCHCGEFCSKIFIARKNRTYWFPKPQKLMIAAQTSFDIKATRETAATTKYVSLLF